ncbi:hypothetical protein PtB15_2B666 [Puccinia triticina]|nr:hypothetical protein PtB15_2B666 [Puccinia triticina]
MPLLGFAHPIMILCLLGPLAGRELISLEKRFLPYAGLVSSFLGPVPSEPTLTLPGSSGNHASCSSLTIDNNRCASKLLSKPQPRSASTLPWSCRYKFYIGPLEHCLMGTMSLHQFSRTSSRKTLLFGTVVLAIVKGESGRLPIDSLLPKPLCVSLTNWHQAFLGSYRL